MQSAVRASSTFFYLTARMCAVRPDRQTGARTHAHTDVRRELLCIPAARIKSSLTLSSPCSAVCLWQPATNQTAAATVAAAAGAAVQAVAAVEPSQTNPRTLCPRLCFCRHGPTLDRTAAVKALRAFASAVALNCMCQSRQLRTAGARSMRERCTDINRYKRTFAPASLSPATTRKRTAFEAPRSKIYHNT